MRGHNFQKIGSFYPWSVCSHCGLVTVKNKRTAKAIGSECKDRVSVYQMRMYDPNDKGQRAEYLAALKRFKSTKGE